MGIFGKNFIFSAAVFLSGCATEITATTGATVVVRAGFPDIGVERALVLADAECQRNKKSAVVVSLTSSNTDKYIFECVRR
jgi:hypothetical protein